MDEEVRDRIETYQDVLDQLREPFGSASAGEIEILSDTQELAERFSCDPNIGVVYRDSYVTILRDPVRFPSETPGAYLRILPANALAGRGGAAVLGLLDGRVVLLEVYRHALRDWEWSIPRGFSKSGEDARATAIRELEEESGYRALDIQPLGHFTPDSGLYGNRVELYFSHVVSGGIRRPEAAEAFRNTALVPVPDLLHQIGEGTIADSFTIVAIARAQLRGLLGTCSTE